MFDTTNSASRTMQAGVIALSDDELDLVNGGGDIANAIARGVGTVVGAVAGIVIGLAEKGLAKLV